MPRRSFIDEYVEFSRADELKDFVAAHTNGPRPKTKGDAATKFKRIWRTNPEQWAQILRDALEFLPAADLRRWARDKGYRAPSKPAAIDALVDCFIGTPDEADELEPPAPPGRKTEPRPQGTRENPPRRTPADLWNMGAESAAPAPPAAPAPAFKASVDLESISSSERKMLFVTAKQPGSGGFFSALGGLARDISSALARAKPVYISPGEAERRFRFDPGHPQDCHAYVRHPCQADYYLIPADANERMASEKMRAVVTIAAAVGARYIELESIEVRQQSIEAHVDLGRLAAGTQFGGKVGRDGSLVHHVTVTLGEPTTAAHVPEELRPWVDADPNLRAFVDMALMGRIDEYRLAVEIRDMEDISAKLPWPVGFSIGGAIRSVATSTWNFRVVFRPQGPHASPWPAEAATPTTPSNRLFSPAPGSRLSVWYKDGKVHTVTAVGVNVATGYVRVEFSNGFQDWVHTTQVTPG